jgi:hypothetical protein
MEKEAPQGAPFLFISIKPDAVSRDNEARQRRTPKLFFD